MKLLANIFRLPVFIYILFLSGFSYGQDQDLKFTHSYIDIPLDPATWGIGGFTANDFDNDGDLDVTIQRYSSGKVYWYQNQSKKQWQKHEIADGIFKQLGAVTLDLNKDGYYDLVMGSYWLENPGNLKNDPGQKWLKHKYNGGMYDLSSHDIVAYDINRDGNPNILSYCQNANNYDGVLRWYDVSDPYHWIYFDIDTRVNKREKPEWKNGVHGGFAPNGVGDLNKDGWPDIVMPQGWYENPGNPEDKDWKMHRWETYSIEIGVPKTLYGRSIRSWITDLDSDGDNDIVYTDCDVENSKAYIIRNVNGGEDFKQEALPFPSGPSGSLHSLGLADLDNDGDIDIFSGEQEDPDIGMKPPGLAERGFVWLNQGPPENPIFEYIIISTDNPGWHDAILKDMDGDGDVDIVTKNWNADKGNDENPDRKWHISYWRNNIVE